MHPARYRSVYDVLLERFGDPIYVNDAAKTRKIVEGVCQACGAMPESIDASHTCERDGLDEKAPPGGEKVVKALKKDKKVKNPWAVAWAQYNKKRKK